MTITVKPDTGYELDELTVTDKNGDKIKLTGEGRQQVYFQDARPKVTVRPASLIGD